jgi:hypothetical protein
MTLSVKDGGTWRNGQMSVKDGGAWKLVQQGFVKDGGTWRHFTSAGVISLPSELTVDVFTTGDAGASAYFSLNSNGGIYYNSDEGPIQQNGVWITPQLNMNLYEARLTVTSGLPPTGAASGAWLNLGTTREWVVTRESAPGAREMIGTLEIRRAADFTVLTTCTLTMRATAFL